MKSLNHLQYKYAGNTLDESIIGFDAKVDERHTMGIQEGTSNTLMLQRVAQSMGTLKEKVAFLGGTIIPFLLTEETPLTIRQSKDVDLIVGINSKHDLLMFEDELWERGFQKIRNGSICIWRLEDINMDLLPSWPVFDFNNKWFEQALFHTKPVHIGSGIQINILHAYFFCSIKLNCFHERGKNDYSTSVDIYDILLVLTGRPEIKKEIAEQANAELREYLLHEFNNLLRNNEALIPLIRRFSPAIESADRIQSLACSRIKAIINAN